MNWETFIPLILAVLSLGWNVWQWVSSKKSREAGLASDYLKIADMSGEQLEKKINQINVLEKQVESLQAQITAMQIDHNNKEVENKKVIEALKEYINVLVGILREHDWVIPPRPDILKESDPKIPTIKQ